MRNGAPALRGLADPRLRFDLPVLRDSVSLDSACTGLATLPVVQAGQDFLKRRSWRETSEDCAVAGGVRGSVAGVTDVKPAGIAFTTNTSVGTSILAEGVGPCQADNVATDDCV